MDDCTLKVSDFYDQFPFPPDQLQNGPPPGFNWRWSLQNAYSFCTGVLPKQRNNSERYQILDAGCGSGVSTDYLAHLNPGSDILAIDISKRSLALARKRLERSGANTKSNITFRNESLLEIRDVGLFDYINSVGVLHHLEDPLAGLNALGNLLSPGGILHLFLYAEGGRFEINRVKKALTYLDLNYSYEDLVLTRKLLEDLPKGNRIRKDYQEKKKFQCSSDIAFADMYLHPKEITFNVRSLYQLIEKSNLEFVDFSNPSVWSLSRLLKGELLDHVKRLSKAEQLELVELLDPDICHFELFLSKGYLEKFTWKDDADVLAATGKVNPCIWGWPGNSLYDSEMVPISVDDNGLKLLAALDKSQGLPLGLLPLDWDQSLIASTARDLHKAQLILLNPV